MLIILQNRKADRFFSAAQQDRLQTLMRLRGSGTLSAAEEKELESLIEAERDGARQRATALLDHLKA